MYAAILGCQCVTVWPGGAAGDMSLPSARRTRGRPPGTIDRHWTFDREHAAVMVGNDQEERGGGFVRHEATLRQQKREAKRVSSPLGQVSS